MYTNGERFMMVGALVLGGLTLYWDATDNISSRNFTMNILLCLSLMVGAQIRRLNRRSGIVTEQDEAKSAADHLMERNAVVNKHEVELKTYPKESSPNVMKLEFGTPVEILEKFGEWANVKVGNVENRGGFVLLSSLDVERIVIVKEGPGGANIQKSPISYETDLESLERLGKLHASGALTDEEFRIQKKKILEN